MATLKSAIRSAHVNTKGHPSTQAQIETGTETRGTIAIVTTPYSQALSRLTPLQPILAGLVHRNRNQHRHATWWRSFGLLRRHCSKFIEDLIPAIAAAEKAARRDAKAKAKAEAKAKSKKRRCGEDHEIAGGELELPRTKEAAGAGPGTGIGTGMSDAKVIEHASWLRDILVPKCYLSFSQLTADGQFAPLGVVLLGVLAQVRAACNLAAPPPPPSFPSPSLEGTTEFQGSSVDNQLADPGALGDSLLVLEPGFKSVEKDTATPKEGNDAGVLLKERAAGIGQAISRKDVERAVELRRKKDVKKTTTTRMKEIEEAGGKKRDIKAANTMPLSTLLPKQPQPQPPASSSRSEVKGPTTIKSIPSKRREHPSTQPQDELDVRTSERPTKKPKTTTSTPRDNTSFKAKKGGDNHDHDSDDDDDASRLKPVKQKTSKSINSNINTSTNTNTAKIKAQRQEDTTNPKLNTKKKKKKKKGDEFDDLFNSLL